MTKTATFETPEQVINAGGKLYQSRAASTSLLEPSENVDYFILGLVGEAGEIANKYKKVIRDDGGVLTDDRRWAIIGELGDVGWYLAMICEALGADFGGVLTGNLQKLAARKAAGTIQGSGDNR